MRNIYATVSLNVVRTDLLYDDTRELLHEWGLFKEAQEVIWIVSYDAATQLRSVVEVARGSQYEVTVDIANVMQAVWASGTSRFQLFHNHPAGIVTPTRQDMMLTEQVQLAASVGDLYLEDHVIIGPPDAWYSMREHKQFQPSAKVLRLTAAANGPVRITHKEPR